jgi:hypothetical protein
MCYLGSDIGSIEGDKRDTRDEPNAPFLLAAPLAQKGQVGALSNGHCLRMVVGLYVLD